MARILWRDAQGHEGAVDLASGEAKIGRSVDCAIRTDDAMVSRNHARVFWQGGQCYVEDLGSANGVFYQEQRITRHALKHGDAVRCGSLWLRFVDDRPQAAQAQRVSAAQPVAAAPPAHAPPPAAAPVPAAAPAASPVPAPIPAAPSGPAPAAAVGGADHEEIRRLRRRVEQLQAELRIYRGGGKGQQMEDMEGEISSLEEERDMLKARVRELEATIEAEGGDAKVRQASQVTEKAAEVVSQLNDLLSNMRINVTAAEGEFDQFAHAIPRASFELIREALRSSAGDVESARELLRALRSIAR